MKWIKEQVEDALTDPEMPELEGPFPSFAQLNGHQEFREVEDDWSQWDLGAGATAQEPRERLSRRPAAPQMKVTASNDFEKKIADKVEYMENLLGRVAGVQQALLQRLIDLFEAQKTKTSKPSTVANGPPAVTTTTATTATAESTVNTAVKDEPVKWELPVRSDHRSESPEGTTVGAEAEWREYHGETIWQREKDKKLKNPFDHKAYIKKDEEVDSFEKLMVITFKTLKQLVDLKYDMKGLIRHGLSMAEKAAEGSYKKIAFIGYDESVRERAGEVGPSAFGTVEYDDIFGFFCADNTIPKKARVKKEGASAGRVKSEMCCIRYNDSICQSKTCVYAHRCSECDTWGHPRKDCRVLADKKKEKK